MWTSTRISQWQTDCWDQPSESVGGDFVLRRRQGSTLRVVVGDACGHGAAAQPVAEYAAKLLRAGLFAPAITTRMLAAWNRNLFARFSNRFVAVTCVELDVHTGYGWVLNSGNPPILIRRADGTVERFASTGMPLGMIDEDAWQPARLQRFRLQPGDALLCFTDGLIERVGLDRDFFGIERVIQAVSTALAASPLRGIRRWLERFSRPDVTQDDLTVLCIRAA